MLSVRTLVQIWHVNAIVRGAWRMLRRLLAGREQCADGRCAYRPQTAHDMLRRVLG